MVAAGDTIHDRAFRSIITVTTGGQGQQFALHLLQLFHLAAKVSGVGSGQRLHIGARDGPGPNRTHAMLALNGLAPYLFEVEGALYLSHKGELTARFETELDQRLIQKLILQPAAEIELSAQQMPDIGKGAGLTSGEAGLRLRYEFVPEFAPYIGIVHHRLFGETARFAQSRGDETSGWRLLLGLRAWF